MASAQELCCIVDENNNVVGAEPRDKTVREYVAECWSVMLAPRSPALRANRRLWGRGSYVLVFDRAGALYVTKRSPRKDVYPGLFDVVTSGVVCAGESYAQTAERELREELSFSGRDPEQLFTFRWVDASCRVWGAVFSARADAPVVHADGEVADGAWLTLQDVSERLEAAPETFTPVGRYILAAYNTHIRAQQRASAQTCSGPRTRHKCSDWRLCA